MRCGRLLVLIGLYVAVAPCTDSSTADGSDDLDRRRYRRSKEPDPPETRDGLALSREIFRNITKQLRDNIVTAKDLTTYKQSVEKEKAEQLIQNVIESDGTSRRRVGPHHHEHHWGPYFEGEGIHGRREGITQESGHEGSEALLSCRVGMLKDKTVMWLHHGPQDFKLLTVGNTAYAGDSRIQVKFQYPNNWRLSIRPVRKEDAGLYMCQVSTHPPRAVFANLTVLDPILTIVDEQEHEVEDRFYKAGSSIELTCKISQSYIRKHSAHPTPQSYKPILNRLLGQTDKTYQLLLNEKTSIVTDVSVELSTSNRNGLLSYSTSESEGISNIGTGFENASTESFIGDSLNETTKVVTARVTEKPQITNIYGLVWFKNRNIFEERVTAMNISSTIFITVASQNDSGIYTCSLANGTAVSVNVQVLIGENQAAVHHDTWNHGCFIYNTSTLSHCLAIIIFRLLFS